MIPGGELHVVGYGRLAARLLPRLTAAHPSLRVTVITRRPERVPLEGLLASDRPLAPGSHPVLIVTSANEGAVLRARPRIPGADIPRGAVLAANVAHLRERLDPAALCDRPVLVVTNPVEAVCDFLREWTGNPRLVGLGMATDAARIADVLRCVSGEPPPPLEVTGWHDTRPIPVLSGHPGLVETWADLDTIAEKLEGWDSPFSYRTDDLTETFRRLAEKNVTGITDAARRAHEILDAAVRAVTLSEFEDGRPPVRRPAKTLAGSLIDWFAGRPLQASAGEDFVGGRYDPTSARHTVPSLPDVEAALLVGTRTRRTAWKEEPA